MTTTTSTTPESWRPNVVASYNPDDLISEALIVSAATKAGDIEGDEPQVLVPYVSVDPDAGFVAEGDDIDLDDVGSNQVAISTDKVAVLTRVSREVMAQPGAAERIANSLRRSITAKVDTAFINNASSPTGLLNIDGVESAGTLSTDLFAAYDAVAGIEDDGGQATHLLINPLDWGQLAKLPTADGSNQSLLADVHDAAARSLAGVPVTVHAAVPTGTALMLDKTEVVGAYGQIMLARSDDAFFAQDAVGVRATFRLGWNVVRPARLRTLTINGGDS